MAFIVHMTIEKPYIHQNIPYARGLNMLPNIRLIKRNEIIAKKIAVAPVTLNRAYM